MKRYLKAGRHETAYLTAFAVYILHQVLSYSLYVSLLPDTLFWFLKLTAAVLLLSALLLQGRLSVQELLTDAFLTGLGILAAIYSRRGFSLLLLLLFLLAAGSLDFWRLLKVNLWTLLGGWLLVTLSCLAGLIENRTYPRPALGVTAQTLGFNYYAYPTMILFTCSVIYLVLKGKKTSWFSLLSVFLLNVLAAQIYTTRIYLWAVAAFEVYLILACKFSLFSLKSRLFLYLARWGHLLCFLGSLALYTFYESSHPLWAALNAALSGRLQLGSQGLSAYGIHLFGTEVIMYGNAERVYGNVTAQSNYIDSGYLYTLLAYGILFTLLLLLCYTWIFQYLYRQKEVLLYGWLGLFMFLNIFNNYLLLLEINPLLLLTLTAVRSHARLPRRAYRHTSKAETAFPADTQKRSSP